MVTKESWFQDSLTETAVFEKIGKIELPEDEDANDSTDEDFDYEAFAVRYKKVKEAEALMVKKELAVEDGWNALPFAPELVALSSGLFLASSVSYNWPGFLPGCWDEGVLEWEFLHVPKVVKLVKEGPKWKLLDLLEESSLLVSGEGVSSARSTREGSGFDEQTCGLASMKMLATGELLLTRISLVPEMDDGGPYRGASYTLYCPIKDSNPV